MIGYVVSMQFRVADMDAKKRLGTKRWERFMDKLMVTLMDRELVGKYADSSCGSTRRADHHLLDVSVLVHGPNDAIAYRMGWEVIWHALTHSADRVSLAATGGQVWREGRQPT